MTVSRVDPQSLSTRAALEGGCALDAGDTVLARQKYTEAGDILDRASRKLLPAADKHLLRFLAASQYYRAGEYKRADRLAARVNPGHLPARHRPKLERFRKTLQVRAADEYVSTIRSAVRSHWMQGNAQEVIRLLQDHPFVYDRATLAVIRGSCCAVNRQWRAAALFNSDAIRFSDENPDALFLCAAKAVTLLTDGQVDGAREYVSHLLELAPTPLNLIAACAYRLHLMAGGDRRDGGELLDLFARAKTGYGRLPEATRANQDVQDFMAYGFVVAAAAMELKGEREAAARLCEEALTTVPASNSVPVIRDLLLELRKEDTHTRAKAIEMSDVLRDRLRPAQSNREASRFGIAA